jgi:hypothetical protein
MKAITLAAQFELEKAAIERQRLIDIPHLQRDVVVAYDTRSRELSHQNLLSGLKIKWVMLVMKQSVACQNRHPTDFARCRD